MLELRTKLSAFSTSITARLRWAFAAILGVLALTAVIGGQQLTRLSDAQQRSMEQSVPALSFAQDLQAQLAQFQRQLLILDNASTVVELTSIQSELSRLNWQLQATVSSVAELKVGDEQRLDLIDALQRLDNAMVDAGAVRTSRLEITARLAETRQILESVREQMQDLIEPLLLQGSIAIESVLESDGAQERNKPIDEEAIADLLSLDRKLTETLFRSYSAIDLAEQLTLRPAGASHASHATSISFNIRTIVQILATLNGRDFQQPLVGHIKRLRATVFAEGGIVPALQAYADLEAESVKAREEQFRQMQRISSSTTATVESAREAFAVSSAQIESALSTTISSLVLCGLLIMVMTLYVLMSIVERQLNRRMALLTKAVLAIAEGDVNRTVGVAGLDELGQMATSLKVFKHNARELHRSNSELEQFAYAASHDLKTPLQDIVTLAEWTLEDSGDELSEECQGNLQKLLVRAQRLARLQMDMLLYSKAGAINTRVGIFEVEYELLELSELLDPEQRFALTLVGDCMSFATYVVPLRQILLNLLTNTIKHHDREKGAVRVQLNQRNGRIHVSYTDDGKGIDPQFHKRVFELFQTLQPKDEIEGSGMGLSLVNKVITYHGGKIALISDPARTRGTTFTFDWPLLSEAANESRTVHPAQPLLGS